MPKIKKSTTTTKSPAPASKSAKTPVRKAVTPATAPAAKKAAIAPAIVATPPRAAARKPVVTTITALCDVGFGNALYIRGEGPGLSWEQGVPMICADPEKWQITLGESARPFTFKLLVNDATWSEGPDFTVESGGRETITPQF